GDGDLDLYVGEHNGVIKVFTNNSGVFTAASDLQAGATAIDVGSSASPTFADIDGDGDLDLYVGEYYATIKVYTNNNGVFTAASDLHAGSIADIDVGTFSDPTFADIDGDGDLDLYVGEYYGSIEFFTNNGSGVFTQSANLQADGIYIQLGDYSAPTFADIDGDGDLDLYVGEINGTITFYENLGLSTGISEIENTEINIYPNPTANKLEIRNLKSPITTISIIDVTGKTVKTIIGNVNTVNVSDLTRGIYFIQIQTEKGLVNKKFIKK
ncbi:MAG: T9SS type A sorting domain-containing protein, partial [Flavobacteriales bacterium]|nr:T9SS type A sorting domain-containing protein [Flavobacteriales bacterium]